MVVDDGHSVAVVGVQDRRGELQQRPVPPQRAVPAGVQAHSPGHQRKFVVAVGVGQVAGAYLGAGVPGAERGQGVAQAAEFQHLVGDRGEGVPAKAQLFEERELGMADAHFGDRVRRQVEQSGFVSRPLDDQRKDVVLGPPATPAEPQDGLGELHRLRVAQDGSVVPTVARVSDELTVPDPGARPFRPARREDAQQQAYLAAVPGLPEMVHQRFEQLALVTIGPRVAAVPGFQALPVELADALGVVPPGDPAAQEQFLRALPIAARHGQLGCDLPDPPIRGLGREVPFPGKLAHQVGGLLGHGP